jgi:hypothetical protein
MTRKLSGGQYFIDHSSLKFESIDNEFSRDFKLDEIAVIHPTKLGTTIARGDNETKFDYSTPKRRGSFAVGKPDVIFIPTITTNYSELIDKIIESSPNAKKITF